MVDSLGPNAQSNVSSFIISERLVRRITESPSITDIVASVSALQTPAEHIIIIIDID